MLSQYVLALSVTGVSMFVLGLFAYFKGPTRRTNRAFGLYYMAVGWWAGFEAISIVAPSPDAGLFFWRLNHVGVILIPVFFLHFVSTLEEPAGRAWKWIVPAGYAFGAFFLMLDATPLLIGQVIPKFSFHYFIEPGPVYFTFFAVWQAMTLTAVLALLRVWWRARGFKRHQMRLFSLSMLVAYAGGMLNFLPTFDLEVPYLMPWGTYAVPALAAVTTYAIIRYQLFDIEVVIKRTVVFAGLSSALLAIVGVIAVWLPAALFGVFNIDVGRFWPSVLSSVVAVFAFERLQQFLVNATDRFLFQRAPDHRALLRRFAEHTLPLSDFSQLSEMAVLTLFETLRLSGAALWAWESPARPWRQVAQRGSVGAHNITTTSPLAHVLQERRSLVCADASIDPQPRPAGADQELAALKLTLLIPLVVQDQIIGLLGLGSKRSHMPFDEKDLDVLLPLCRTLSIAMSHTRLFAELAEKEVQATTDSLTGTLTRRAFMEQATRALETAGRASLLMADLDHFKEKNDTYGHLVGDLVLRETAQRLTSGLRGGDLVGRYGGEEFVLLLPNAAPHHALQVAERLRQTVGGRPIHAGTAEVRQTLSIGIASLPEHGRTLVELVGKADLALYTAKRAGRDRVLAAEQSSAG
jgi:diguanylate cyclase (GGDEF)-like protein